MELLYSYEHIACHNYDGGLRPSIEIKKLNGQEQWDISILENKIIFVTEGELKFSYGNISDELLSKGKGILLPSGANFKSIATKETSLTIFRLRSHVRLCDQYSLERLLREEDISQIDRQSYLDINSALWNYLNLLNTFVNDGLKCVSLFEIKLKELFFLLRAYYTKGELLGFFYPLLTSDTKFSDIILLNYRKAKTVKDLAILTHYSVSGFEKRFKRAFNVAPSQWLKQQRAKNIYHEINCSNKTLKEISSEYGFASPAHLNDFCKTYFGVTPGKIRKQSYEKQE